LWNAKEHGRPETFPFCFVIEILYADGAQKCLQVFKMQFYLSALEI
jgi:hypothetical protein